MKDPKRIPNIYSWVFQTTSVRLLYDFKWLPDANNGWNWITKKVKAVNPSVKMILISAFDLDYQLFEEYRCVDKILQKPIAIPELINEVERLMPIKSTIVWRTNAYFM